MQIGAVLARFLLLLAAMLFTWRYASRRQLSNQPSFRWLLAGFLLLSLGAGATFFFTLPDVGHSGELPD